MWARLQLLTPYLLAVLSGLLLQLAFPARNWTAMVWIWALPLLSQLWPVTAGASAPRHPFRLGYLAGLAFFIPNLAWVRHSSRVVFGALDHQWIGWGPELLGWTAVTLLSAFLALYFGLWSWFTARLARPREAALCEGTSWVSSFEGLRCAGLAAAAWVTCEWLRGWILTGFGWNGLGVAFYQDTVLIQTAEWIGVTGLAFLPVFLACLGWINVLRLVRHWRGQTVVRTRLDFTVGMILLLASAIVGLLKARQAPPDDPVALRTLMVQPNIPQVERWSTRDPLPYYQQLDQRTRLYTDASDDASDSPIDLVVWPEAAVSFGLDEGGGMAEFNRSFFDSMLEGGRFAILTGVQTRSEDGEGQHNSAVLFDGDSIDQQQRAHKIHLVPFGEYLPFRDTLPFMEALLGSLLPGDFDPGTSHEPLSLEVSDRKVGLVPLICFEDTVGRLARKFARPGAQLLVNVTNDGWFLQSAETEVHLANAVFRCVELRRPMVRAANTGVTCVIDPLGRVVSRLEDPTTGSSFIEGVLPGQLQLDPEAPLTFYARYGDVFSWLCAALSGGFVASFLLKRKKSPPADVSEQPDPR